MRTPTVTQFEKFLPWLLFLLVFFVGMFLVPGVAPAWDEPDNIFSGGQYAKFFQQGFRPEILTSRDKTSSLFSKTIYTQEPAIARYPPIPNYVGVVLSFIQKSDTSQEIIDSFHVSTVLFFALLVTFVYKMGRLINLSWSTSLFSALLTFLYPTLFGHGLTNIKDTAQVALFTVTLYYLVKKRVVAGGIFWGLALATKFNAIYVPIIWTVWMFPYARKKLLIVVLIGLFVAIAVWPYLWFDTIDRIVEVISYFSTVGQGYKIFWDGVLYEVGVGKTLWWYPWANLLKTTPIPLLVLWFAGFVHVLRNPKFRPLAFWFTVPLVRAFFPHAAFYDGVRHFLEILPAGALIIAIGFAQLVKFVKLNTLEKITLASLLLGHLLFINATYFPYSTGYYNILAKNPNQRFDRDIEALSIKEAVEYLHKKYGAINLWCLIGGHISWYYLTSQDHYTYPQDADSIILVNKSSHIRQWEQQFPMSSEFSLDHVISRGDAVFAWIYRRKLPNKEIQPR